MHPIPGTPPAPTMDEIRSRWAEDSFGALASDAAIALAIQRTGNVYGITPRGRPYIEPKEGFPVSIYSGENGVIVEVAPDSNRDEEPTVIIETTSKRRVYLYQTAVLGYAVLPPAAPDTSPPQNHHAN